MTVTVPKLPLPERSKITLKVEVTADFNVTAFVAQQKVNRYLILHVGDMLHAGEPELVLSESLRWRVPILFSTREKGQLGKVGELLVNVDSGEIIIENPEQLEEIATNAEALYQRSALSTGAGQ